MKRINELTFELNGKQYHFTYYERPIIITNGVFQMVKPVLREYIETYGLPIDLFNKNGNLETTNSLANKILQYFTVEQETKKNISHFISKKNYETGEIRENNFKLKKFKKESALDFKNKRVKPNKTIIANLEKEKSEIEVHPYLTTKGFTDQLNYTKVQIENEGFIDGGIWLINTKTIICGTFPPRKEHLNRKGYIHYSSTKNKFWKHIDKIYKTNLYLNSENEEERINNSIEKIEFLKSKKIGFIDVFSKIERKHMDSSKDNDLISVETIFENGIFDKILKSDVVQFVFVYSLSRDIFVNYIERKFGTKLTLVRRYKKDEITLEVNKVKILGKDIYLSYSPIHGNIEDVYRQPALKKAIELDFN